VLQQIEPIGSDAIGVDYKSATIKIDAASDPDVRAETDTGKKLAIDWTAGFSATDGSTPVIQGPKGAEVARDGTVIDVPDGAYPRLVGTSCAGPRRAVRPGSRSAVDPRGRHNRILFAPRPDLRRMRLGWLRETSRIFEPLGCLARPCNWRVHAGRYMG
jgi:hypothetical protein